MKNLQEEFDRDDTIKWNKSVVFLNILNEVNESETDTNGKRRFTYGLLLFGFFTLMFALVIVNKQPASISTGLDSAKELGEKASNIEFYSSNNENRQQSLGAIDVVAESERKNYNLSLADPKTEIDDRILNKKDLNKGLLENKTNSIGSVTVESKMNSVAREGQKKGPDMTLLRKEQRSNSLEVDHVFAEKTSRKLLDGEIAMLNSKPLTMVVSPTFLAIDDLQQTDYPERSFFVSENQDLIQLSVGTLVHGTKPFRSGELYEISSELDAGSLLEKVRLSYFYQFAYKKPISSSWYLMGFIRWSQYQTQLNWIKKSSFLTPSGYQYRERRIRFNNVYHRADLGLNIEYKKILGKYELNPSVGIGVSALSYDTGKYIDQLDRAVTFKQSEFLEEVYLQVGLNVSRWVGNNLGVTLTTNYVPSRKAVGYDVNDSKNQSLYMGIGLILRF